MYAQLTYYNVITTSSVPLQFFCKQLPGQWKTTMTFRRRLSVDDVTDESLRWPLQLGNYHTRTHLWRKIKVTRLCGDNGFASWRIRRECDLASRWSPPKSWDLKPQLNSTPYCDFFSWDYVYVTFVIFIHIVTSLCEQMSNSWFHITPIKQKSKDFQRQCHNGFVSRRIPRECDLASR